jgi:hypothetical protein
MLWRQPQARDKGANLMSAKNRAAAIAVSENPINAWRMAGTLTAFVALFISLSACDPVDRRPGFWLTGEATETPSDWSFTDAHKEIAIEVQSPYLVSYAVTIWCAQVDGTLYVGASAPDTKNWPGWVDNAPDVRLQIDGKVYEGTLAEFSDEATAQALQQNYAVKYDLDPEYLGGATASKFWRVDPRV